MIKIRDENDFSNWFKKNYKKVGFTKIFKDNKGKFPDFIMVEGDKRVKVELEIKSSNFLLHKHDINKVDKVVCVDKDVNLNIPIITIDNIKLINFDQETPFSIKNQIYKLFEKEKVLTSNETSQKLEISWNTADTYLKELLIEGKIIRVKKEGVNLWLKK